MGHWQRMDELESKVTGFDNFPVANGINGIDNLFRWSKLLE